jgi:hypothetical protein
MQQYDVFYFNDKQIEQRLVRALDALMRRGLGYLTKADIERFELRRITKIMKRFGFSVELSSEDISFEDCATGRRESFRIDEPDPAELALGDAGNELMKEGYVLKVGADGIPRVYHPSNVDQWTANRKVAEVLKKHGFDFNPDTGRCRYEGARLLEL